MAVTKSIIKQSDTEAVVKIAGSAGNATIDLDVDLLLGSQALDGATQTVSITGVSWTGEVAALIVVDRNSVRVMTLNTGGSGMLFFDGQTLPPENTNSTSDIVVTISGGIGEVWLKLRKVAGYKSKIEDWKYGSYDDPTRIGASTTLNGSPDKV
jgi:hypothetical protein